MLKRKIMELFREYDNDIKLTIAQVIKFEQENITRDRPSYKNEIKEIIDRIVKDDIRTNNS